MHVEQPSPYGFIVPRRTIRYLVVTALLCAVGSVPAQAGDIYIGAHASADRLGVLYDKAVAASNLATAPLGTAEILKADGSATELSYSYGFLAGYKIPFSVTGVYAAIEGDMARHGGAPAGRLLGDRAKVGDYDVGEIISEEWTLESDRSFGLTARIGTGIPFFGTWVGPSIYALGGVRRLSSSFSASYRGCFESSACVDWSTISSVRESFDKGLLGWTVGGGIETKLGMLSVRAEVRLIEYGSADGGISIAQGIANAPVKLEPDSLSFGLSLLWYF